jgi:hypothetical protein
MSFMSTLFPAQTRRASLSCRAFDVTRALASLYTATFVVGTVTSIRRGLRAEPLGMRTGLTPAMDVVVGGGAALAAPWPMIVVLWRCMRRAAADGPGRYKARRRLALLAALFLAGSVGEPISHRLVSPRLSADVTVIAGLNIVLPAAMLVSALAAAGEESAGAAGRISQGS